MMEKRAQNRFGRVAWLMAMLALLLLLATTALAQDAPTAPAAPSAATLTLGVATTPAGGQNFRLTAASFQTSWGRAGKQPGQFRQPRDVAVDANGTLYVSDHRNSRIQKFSPAGAVLGQIGTQGKAAGKLLRPNAIAIYNDLIIITDTDNHRISVFNTNGTFVRQWGSFGTGNGQFNLPMGVAVDTAGNVYVTDTWNHRIQVFTIQGVYQRQWGTLGNGDGQFRFPAHLDFGPGGSLFVADSNNHRVQVFDANGTFQRKFGLPGPAAGRLWLPVGIDVTGDGYVYVSDTYNYRLQKFTTNGDYVAQWNETAGANPIGRPNGLLSVGNLVYATDIDSNRVQIYAQGTVTVNAGATQALTLPAGAYNVTQTPKAGWTFGSATCTGGNPTTIANGVRLSLADGAAVSCTFASNQ